MKRYICCFIALWLVIFCGIYAIWYIIYGCNYTHGIYQINISDRCILNDSVGNEWIKKYTMDGGIIENGQKINVPLETVTQKTIKVTITERDKYPDESSKYIQIFLRDNETKNYILTVTEDEGRFKGNVAKWEISVSVKFLGKTVKEE